MDPGQIVFVNSRFLLSLFCSGVRPSRKLLACCSTTLQQYNFSKAFDVVSHDKLLIRLNTYGITGMLLKWLQSFLSNRTHCTKLAHHYLVLHS